MSFQNRDNGRSALKFTLQSQLNSEKCVVLQIHKDILYLFQEVKRSKLKCCKR